MTMQVIGGNWVMSYLSANSEHCHQL